MIPKNKRNNLWFLILAVTIFNVNAIQEHEVRLNNLGELVGSYIKTEWSNQTVIQFLGIPYGISPSIDNKRFEPVKEAKSWEGVKDATAYGRRCPDSNVPFSYKKNHENEDIEDCLTLNVYTKELHGSRPVMVYMYDNNEFTNISDYAPVYLMDKKDIVYVSISYRTGILGFAALGLVSMPGNAGVADVQLALKWIKQHISQFGGSPNHITIFGDPSIVGALLVSHSVDSTLFQRAIIQSAIYDGLKDNTKTNIDLICLFLGCPICTDDISVAECFKKANIFQLMEKSKGLKFSLIENDQNAPQIFSTAKKLLTEEPKSIKYPVMMGATKHDGSSLVATFEMFLTFFTANDNQPMDNSLFKRIGVDEHHYFNKTQLKEKNLTNLLPGIVDIFSDRFVKTPLLKFIEKYRKLNKYQLYLYTFDYVGSYTLFPKNLQLKYPVYPCVNGVHHGDDFLYLFKLANLNKTNDINMAKTMVDLWTSFAIDGKPKTSSFQNIPRLTSNVGPYFHINNKITIGTNFSTEGTISNTEYQLGTHLDSIASNSVKLFKINIFYAVLAIFFVILTEKCL